MRSSHSLDALNVMFDDDHLVADAGLILPATLGRHLGLKALVDTHVDLGAAAGRANVGDKVTIDIDSSIHETYGTQRHATRDRPPRRRGDG